MRQAALFILPFICHCAQAKDHIPAARMMISAIPRFKVLVAIELVISRETMIQLDLNYPHWRPCAAVDSGMPAEQDQGWFA